MKRSYAGFTIVELLIVIVVIAILAAISIVAYNGVQDRARASSASQAVAQAGKKVKVWQVDKEGQNPSCAEFYEVLTGTGSGAPSNTCIFDYKNTNYQYAVSGGNYCVTTTVGNKSYTISPTSTPNEGTCIGHTSGGSSFATNLITNPSFESGTTGWTNYTGGVVSSVSGTGVMAGNSAMEVTVTSANQSGARYAINGLSPNTAYTFSIYITPISGDLANLGINVGDGAGTRANNAFGSSLVAGQTVRKTATWTSSAGPGTTQFAVFRMAAGTGAATFRVDAAMLEQGSSATGYNG